MGMQFRGATQRVMQALMAIVLVVAALHFAREILLPLAMAVLLTFLLAPLVTALEHRRLPRPAAVLLVMLTIALLTGSAGWAVGDQLSQLAVELPQYRQNLNEKVASLRFDGTAWTQVQKAIKDVSGDTATPKNATHEVRIVPDEAVPFDKLAIFTRTVLTPLANAAIVVVLVLFMLMNREDLRNRIVRLAGKRLTLTTRTLDEIGTGISRYLLTSVVINGGFGLAVGFGLWLIGVHYALMWGFLAGVLRYVPYVGPGIGGLLPITMAFIQFPGEDWAHLAMTAGLFIVLELITYNIVEPLLYGYSAGVSTVALLTSVMFWTWIWGPLGLVLAVPLTVVMAVLGKHVPALEPLGILLADKPALASHVAYYQRLLAHDVREATSILAQQQQSGGLRQVYDRVLIPALVLAEKDHEQGELASPEREFIWESTRELIERMEQQEAQVPDDAPAAGPGLRTVVVGCPAQDEADVLALDMLTQLMAVQGGRWEVLSAQLLASEVVARIAEEMPDAVCISSLGKTGVRQTRYLLKRLRHAFPELRILVGRWGFQGNRGRMAENLKRRGADQVVTTLAEARDLLVHLHRAPVGTVCRTGP